MKKLLISSIMIVLSVVSTNTHAIIIQANASLDYAQEVNPSNPIPSNSTGTAMLTFDTDLLTMSINAEIIGIFLQDILFPSGLLSFDEAGPFHIHEAPAGVNGPVVLPFNMLSFFTETTEGLSIQATDVSFNASLIDALLAGNLYLNVHTLDYGSGEIRGQIAAVSTPTTYSLMGLSFLLVMLRKRKS